MKKVGEREGEGSGDTGVRRKKYEEGRETKKWILCYTKKKKKEKSRVMNATVFSIIFSFSRTFTCISLILRK